MNLVERLLHDHRDQLRLRESGIRGRMETALLTPRFDTSRHVVALVHPKGRRAPKVVAKLPRRPGDTGGIAREADLLERVAALAEVPLSVPRVLGMIAADGHDVLVETVVPGAPLDPARVRREPGRAIGAGEAFVTALPETLPAAQNAGWYDRAVTRPLERLADAFPLGGTVADLAQRTHAVLEPLHGAELPAVLEHGDLSHPNLLLERQSGALGVIDWERAALHGVPGQDLVFFLQFVAESLASAVSPRSRVAAFERAFLDTGTWAPPVLQRYLTGRGMDPALWPYLVVVAWARATASYVDRLGSAATDGGEGAEAAEALTKDRDLHVWRRAVEATERGQLHP